jgi:hypothetical protein
MKEGGDFFLGQNSGFCCPLLFSLADLFSHRTAHKSPLINSHPLTKPLRIVLGFVAILNRRALLLFPCFEFPTAWAYSFVMAIIPAEVALPLPCFGDQ